MDLKVYIVICGSADAAEAAELAASGPAYDNTVFGGLGYRFSDGTRFAYALCGTSLESRVKIWSQLDGVHPGVSLYAVADLPHQGEVPGWMNDSGWQGEDLALLMSADPYA